MKYLSDRLQQFVEEYLVDLDAVKAAERAGYSHAYAIRRGKELLELPVVQEALVKARAERIKRTHVTADSVVRELAAVGFASLADVCRWSGNSLEMLDSENLSHEQVASIAEVVKTTTSRGGTLRIKQHSKLKALELLARHVGIFSSSSTAEDTSAMPSIDPDLAARLSDIYSMPNQEVDEEQEPDV